jgi:predicted HicB family RNase H-like nuclease
MPRPKIHTDEAAYRALRNAENRNKEKTQIAIRIPLETRTAWHAAASRRGMTLKDWIIEHLDRAVQEELATPH